MIQIPSTERIEWKDLVTGHSEIKLTNFFFRTKVEQTRNLVSQGKITTIDAINDLHKICIELAKTRDIDDDIEIIFGKDIYKEEKTTILENIHTEIKKNPNEAITPIPTIDFNQKEPRIAEEDIHTRINRIQEEAAIKRKAFKKKTLSTKLTKDIHIIYEDFSPKNDKKSKIDSENLKTKEKSKVKDSEQEKNDLRKASIERRNKILKENRDILRTKDKTSIGSIIKSIFN